MTSIRNPLQRRRYIQVKNRRLEKAIPGKHLSTENWLTILIWDKDKAHLCIREIIRDKEGYYRMITGWFHQEEKILNVHATNNRAFQLLIPEQLNICIKNKPQSITYALFKINSKWIIGLNEKWKSIKPREENINEKSLYACLEEFLDIIPKHN